MRNFNRWVMSFLTALALIVPSTASADDFANLGTPNWAGRYEVTSGLTLSAQELQLVREFGCVAGPGPLFSELISESLEETGAICNEWFFDRVEDMVEEGSNAWFITVTPVGALYVTYHKGISQSPNITCVGTIPNRPSGAIPLSCVDSASGGMTIAATLSNLIGTGGAYALGAAVGNLTAKRSGGINITTGSEANAASAASASAAAAASSSGFGGGAPCTSGCGNGGHPGVDAGDGPMSHGLQGTGGH